MRVVFILFGLIISTNGQNPAPVILPCPKDFDQYLSVGCFHFTTFPYAVGFDEAYAYCRNKDGHLVVPLSETENNYLMGHAEGQWDSAIVFWLGLNCANGKLGWDYNCPVPYTNFDSKGLLELSSDLCALDSNHFIETSGSSFWIKADASTLTDKIVCSWRPDDVCGKDPSDDTLARERAIIAIIIGVTLLTVVVLCIAVCGCFAITRKFRERRQQENEKIAAFLKDNNMAVDIQAGKFRFQASFHLKMETFRVGKAAAAVEAVEHTQSMRYTPFPRAEGAGFDEWEIDRRHVIIDYNKKLGQGAFGSVYLGIVASSNIPTTTGKSIIEQSTLRKDNDAVAIKMLHESADKLQQMQFFEEIDLMKRLGYHERLVNMLGCATQSEPAMLIIEYCSHGDLLNYMRERREAMLNHSHSDYYYDRTMVITQKQQFMFCVQIAYGLEYLSQHGFVHRDIAARNILVDQHQSCKIGDFGLCREVEKENEHYHSRGGRLPLKWMSPEAIERYEFSIASDVWAFGVLLFEIITLGGNPYPDWPAAEILNRLKRGQRMDRPDNCSDHMFAVMNSCWLQNPDDRPNFSDLRMKMGVGLEEVSDDDYYLKLDARALYYCTQSEIDGATEAVDEESDEVVRL